MFYQQILHAWFSLKRPPQNALDIRREVLYLNKDIMIENTYVFLPEMISRDIYLIHQLMDNHGKFLTYENFCTKYGNIIPNFAYIALIDAIPVKWRQNLRQQNCQDNICNINELPYCNLENKDTNLQMVQSSDIYWHILSKNKNRPTCIKSWNNILKVDTNDQKWKEIFMLPLISVKEIRIRELQLKIIHRFYASQNKVSRWDDTVSNICKLCDVGIADIVHTFAECVIISNFWKFLTQWINDCTQGTLSLKTEQILFGSPIDGAVTRALLHQVESLWSN